MTSPAIEAVPAAEPGAVFSTRRFSELPLHEALQQNLARAGFTHCTPIQEVSLESALAGRDLLGKAQTGTGKTAAFLITILQRFLDNPAELPPGQIRALIVAPTRELALQIEKDALQLSKDLGLGVQSVIGGTDMERQQRLLALKPCSLLIATPGRLLDLRRRGTLSLKQVEVLVLDEADRLLDMGFLPDLRRIVSSCPPAGKRQTLLFSATFSALVIRLAGQWAHQLKQVSVAEKAAAESVQQIVYNARSSDRLPFLLRLLKDEPGIRALVFANRRTSVRTLFERIRRDTDLACEMIAGDMPQNKRKAALEKFRAGRIRALIATDVAGRGLHVEGVTHVINYDLPEDPEQYVHRIGRTGRIGASGISISFATEEQAFAIPEIEACLGEPIRCVPLPSAGD